MNTPDDQKRLMREVEAQLKLHPTPSAVSPWDIKKKYEGPNPYAGPDPKGDAEIELPGGHLSTPATRAVTRGKLAAAWEDGKRAYRAANPAA